MATRFLHVPAALLLATSFARAQDAATPRPALAPAQTPGETNGKGELENKSDIPQQVRLFTADAVVETFRREDGKEVPTGKMTGHKEIGDAFGGFLKRFETVYHINGQSTASIHGARAHGVVYCAVTLIGLEDGTRIKTSMGVHYNDDYVYENGRWLIARRQSIFDWTDRQEMAMAQHVTAFTGTWKLDLAKSSFQPGPPFQRFTITFAPDGVRHLDLVRADGQNLKVSLPWSDGRSVAVKANLGLVNATAVSRILGRAFDDTWWDEGRVIERVHGALSEDGSTLTVTVEGPDGKGGSYHNRLTFEKQ